MNVGLLIVQYFEKQIVKSTTGIIFKIINSLFRGSNSKKYIECHCEFYFVA